MVKNLKIDWKDFALGFFIGVTLCLYSYVSQELDTNSTEPTSRITGMVVTEQGYAYALIQQVFILPICEISVYTKGYGEKVQAFSPFLWIQACNMTIWIL